MTLFHEETMREFEAMLSSAFTIRSTGIEQTQQENEVKNVLKGFLTSRHNALLEEVEREVEGMKIDMESPQNQLAEIMLDQKYEVIGWNRALSDIRALINSKKVVY